VILPALAVTALLLFVARPLAVVICMLPFRIPWKEQAVLSWAGLRGAVPIVLATFPATAGLPGGETIFNVVFFVVLTSTMLQATTVVPLVRRLGLAVDRPAWDTIAEALPLDEVDIDLAEIHVRADLPIVGKRLREIPVGKGMLVTTIIRDHKPVVPTGTTRIQADDLVLMSIDLEEASLLDATAWARGETWGDGGNPPAPR
jgi:cell volume regulation protein A